MNGHSIVDVEARSADLKLVVDYAAKAGLLRDRALFEAVDSAERALADPNERDAKPLVTALNDVVRAIAPMTLADLRFGRDPFLAANQRRARSLQLWLTIFALLVLSLIGYSMHALHQEQEAMTAVEQAQKLNPRLGLVALRKMAQFDKPLSGPSLGYDQYHQKISELLLVNRQLVRAYTAAKEASAFPLLPFADHIADFFSPGSSDAAVDSPVAAPGADDKPDPAFKATTTICTVDEDSELKLPAEWTSYPKWMQVAMRDGMTDFCFQLKVVAPNSAEPINPMFDPSVDVPKIKQHVSLRTAWLLPFFYGLLGSVVFVMRNVASVRTAAVEWFPVVMRISLGGVAGVVIGWFGAPNSLGIEGASALSLPFALAFVIGYGIDVLFQLLDRFTHAIGTPSAAPHA